MWWELPTTFNTFEFNTLKLVIFCMKAPIKKKKFDKDPAAELAALKEKLGLKFSETHMVVSSAEKKQEFIPMPEAFVEALKLPGIPQGVTTIIHGHSNTGKSLLKNCLIASAQRMGILPVIYETESNFSFPFAIACGMRATPIYGDVDVEEVDEQTGEITIKTENQIVDCDGPFLYYDNAILADRYGNYDYAQGKEISKKRTLPVIEDIARSMNELLDLQEEGAINQPLLFIWDSVGSIPSFRSFSSKSNNAMWDAGALSTAFNILLNNRIPSSKKVSSPYTNTFVAVNKVWLDSMSAPMGPPSIKMKGGNALLYSSRLTILLGGKLSAATKKLTAEFKGEKYTYGLTTKIAVEKNQLDAPYTITYAGTIHCVPDGMVADSKLNDYKKENISSIAKQLVSQMKDKGKEVEIKEEDIVFSEEEYDD